MRELRGTVERMRQISHPLHLDLRISEVSTRQHEAARIPDPCRLVTRAPRQACSEVLEGPGSTAVKILEPS